LPGSQYGGDTAEYMAARSHLDRLTARMSEYKQQEIYARQALSHREVREQYARLRERPGRALSGTTGDEWSWQT